jgi:hypothetical protein
LVSEQCDEATLAISEISTKRNDCKSKKRWNQCKIRCQAEHEPIRTFWDEIFFEADNNAIDRESSEGALGLVDLSAGLTGDRWAVSVWGRNLSDERYRRQVLNSTGNSQREIWAEPRTVGLRLTYSFGE